MAALQYNDIDPRKTAFILELDDVLFPAKDYIYQVYYLFASLLEYTDLTDAMQTTNFMVDTYLSKGHERVFDELVARFCVEERYRDNLEHLLDTARLPLKLLLFQNMLTLMQEVVTDRKKLFIVTNGKPARQLNKIKQVEWHGLEPYLTCYFADEISAKPEPDVIDALMAQHGISRREVVMIGREPVDARCAENAGVDFFDVAGFV